MSVRLFGVGASAGRGRAPARWVRWDLPDVPHRTISAARVDAELRRFDEAREWARERIEALQEETARRVGSIEAKVFDPQILMLDDPDLVEGTRAYIRENYLAAERAFEWRLLEIRSRFLDTAHAMVIERLADLRDIRLRVLSYLQGLDEEPFTLPETPSILLFEELTPSFAVRLDPDRVSGIVSESGTRGSHSAVLARSMAIPMVVGVGRDLETVQEEATVILDGGTGRIIVDPTESETQAYLRMVDRLSSWQAHLEELSRGAVVTTDGQRVHLRANLDQPDDARAAARVGAEGVGLFRSEFLVIGRRVIPSEDEQFEAYGRVVEAFPEGPVTLRTFDLGGDKFPLFLDVQPEENPYLGWRAIRVCLDLPDLFRNQLRAAARAARDGGLRLLLPFVTTVEEIRRTRALLREVSRELESEGTRVPDLPLGVMVETPSLVEILDLVAPLVDFLSVGTNDLTQYVLAVDRGNARLADRSEPLHPALIRLYRRIRERSVEHDLPVAVCGDLAADPVGVAVLLGLGYRDFSLSPSVLPEVRELLRAVSAAELAEICLALQNCETAGEVRAPVARYLEAAVPFEIAIGTGLTTV